MCKIQISSRMQVRRQVCTQTQLNLLTKRTNQQLWQFTLRRMMNARCNYRKCSRMTRPNSKWVSIISRTGNLESSRQGPKISEILTLQHSRKGLSNGPCGWKKGKEATWFLHQSVFTIPFSFFENQHKLLTPAMLLHLTWRLRKKERTHRGLIWWEKAIWPQKSKIRFESRRIHQLLFLQMGRPIRQKKQQHLSVIWTCLFTFNYWKNHPLYFRWVNCAKRKVTRVNGIQVSHHISSRKGETRVYNRQTHSLACPGRAHNRSPV